MEQKVCTKCGKSKPLDGFGTRKLRSGNTGLRSNCKECKNAKNRSDYAANPAPVIARTTARNAANPEAHRAAARRSMAKRRAEHPDAHRLASQSWRRNNPDAVARADRQKRERNPELYRAISAATTARRRARVAGAYVEDVDRKLVWFRDAGVCHLCGLLVTGDWQLEHVVPLAMGGAHSYQNTAVSHPACNQSKNHYYVPSALGLLGSYVVRPASCP